MYVHEYLPAVVITLILSCSTCKSNRGGVYNVYGIVPVENVTVKSCTFNTLHFFFNIYTNRFHLVCYVVAVPEEYILPRKGVTYYTIW